ncbi:MAG: hypothetical protein WAM53_00600 [Terrimicrobiaceae bacterium]
MKIQIVSIHNAGELDQEYVSLEAKEKCKAFSYLLARTTSMKENELSSRLPTLKPGSAILSSSSTSPPAIRMRTPRADLDRKALRELTSS